MDQKLAKRFWQKVAIADPRKCWEWQATRHAKGYGCFRIKKRWFRASRIAWELARGEIPSGMNILHTCDNPACCNPDHLFVGSQADNVRDMTEKGRRHNHQGEGHGRSVLKESDVQSIRQRLSLGETQKALAMAFGVSLSTIHSIKEKKTWRHL